MWKDLSFYLWICKNVVKNVFFRITSTKWITLQSNYTCLLTFKSQTFWNIEKVNVRDILNLKISSFLKIWVYYFHVKYLSSYSSQMHLGFWNLGSKCRMLEKSKANISRCKDVWRILYDLLAFFLFTTIYTLHYAYVFNDKNFARRLQVSEIKLFKIKKLAVNTFTMIVVTTAHKFRHSSNITKQYKFE